MNQMTPPGANPEIEQHRRAVRKKPRDANAHALLGLSLLRQRQLDEGVRALQRAFELKVRQPELHAVLAAALFELERYEEAAASYRQALRVQDAADLQRGLADSLSRLGRHQQAEDSARRAVALKPDDVGSHLLLVGALYKQQRLEEAADVLRRVLKLEPQRTDARYDLGYVLYSLHRHKEALACMERVVAEQPAHLNALRHIGLCRRALGKVDDAVVILEEAVAREPDNGQLVAELAGTLHMLGRLPEAVAMSRRAQELDPANIMALRTGIHTRFALGEWQEALRLARELLAHAPSPEHHSMLLFILSHCCQDGDELTREHFAYGERWETPLRALRQPHANVRDPQRKLRIGLVSGDLYRHAVARFIAPVLRTLKNSTQVEFYVYHNQVKEDEMTHTMRADVAAWRSIMHLDDAAAERLIRADAIDILIDLSGHSALNRLPLFARKPAPVQATWIGYAGTTGLEAVDYILGDRFWLPGTRYDRQFTENIVRLPMFVLFLPEPTAPPVNPLPALENGYITFGSFHRASKLGQDVIRQWSLLLHAIPTAKMLLGGMQEGIDDVLVDWFAQEGIPRERLLLRERAGMYHYLKQHYEVDICLSPFPYSGGTTIGHALWMGVPTLATVGATNPSHAAAAFMMHLGLGAFVTESEETYVKLGALLSENVSALATMRQTMRQRFLESPLGYPAILGASFEIAMRRMWTRWCDGQEAAPFPVSLADVEAYGRQPAAPD
ncbi:protein O-GlcNAc transferase [Massilia sp. UYP32]|uniref:protein O-GlcNAc transferase n=1 Tax=Massilia timonae CCUG 45783 TaxID=883126 RepID=K9DQV2_9BURK|nr:glycosyltransferase family 41 protein [Massilia timonae]EKU81112.1 hypothetical protein HMPREF9710_03571 [Massilia timonae CCUG 45783]